MKKNYKHLQPDYLRDVINRDNDTAQFVLQPSSPTVPVHRLPLNSTYFLREMAPPGRGCVVWTFGLVSAPSYPRHLSRSPPRAPATHANSGAAGLRPPPLFSTINPRLNFHAIRSAVRLPRASQPLLLPVGRDAVRPSSVPHGVKAKCSGSWSG